MASTVAQSNGTAAVQTTAQYLPKNATQQQLAYVTQILPYVLVASQKSGIPPEVFIIQSGYETGWGTSGWWTKNHNPAGIGVTGQPGAGNTYTDLQQAFDDYAAKLLGKGEAGQQTFVADVQRGATARQLLIDLEQSPWAAGHYGGHGLENTFDSLYGGAGSSSTQGTGGLGGGGGGVVATTTGVVSDLLGGFGGLIGDIPGLGGILGAATAPVALAGVFVRLIANWRYVLEVLFGIGLAFFGATLILWDTGITKKAISAVPMAAAAAA